MKASVIQDALTHLTITEICKPSSHINVPVKISQGDMSENVSEITGIAIPSYYQYSKTKHMTIYNEVCEHGLCATSTTFSKHNSNDECCIIDSDDEDTETHKTTIEDWKGYGQISIEQLCGFQINGIQSKQDIHKLSQIHRYDWITKNQLDTMVSHIESLEIGTKGNYETFYQAEGTPELMTRKLIGYDCLTHDSLYEFKCVKHIEAHHYVQLALYMYLHKFNNPFSSNITYYLFNILTKELHTIDASYSDLVNMVSLLMYENIREPKKVNDDTFYEMNSN